MISQAQRNEVKRLIGLGLSQRRVAELLDEHFIELPTVEAYQCNGCEMVVIYRPCLVCQARAAREEKGVSDV